MDQAMTQMDRVLNTPLPVAYTILISQISWVYVLVLPFQLFSELRWITIPGSISNSSPSVLFFPLASTSSNFESLNGPFLNRYTDETIFTASGYIYHHW